MLSWLTVTEKVLGAGRPDLPQVDRARCLTARSAASSCDACSSVCPRGAMTRATRPTVDPDRCDGCAACAAACPTGALTCSPIAADTAAWLTAVAAAPDSAASVRCEQVEPSAASTELALPCLGALHPADLVTAGLSRPAALSLRSGDCDGCSHAVAGARIGAIAATANATLGTLGHPDVAVSQHTAAGGGPTSPAPRAMTRRGLFRLARSQVRRVAVEVVRESEPVTAGLDRRGPVPARAVRLARAIAAAADTSAGGVDPAAVLPREIGAGVVTVSAMCDGCGLCILGCPHGALAMTSGRPSATFASCTACGLCAEVCPISAIDVTDAPIAAFGASSPGQRAPADDVALASFGRLAARAASADGAMRAAASAQLLGNAVQDR